MKKLFLACFILMGFLTKAQTDLPEISSIEKIIVNSATAILFGILELDKQQSQKLRILVIQRK
jgi:ABC-type transport system involved in cytochrome c biogenesis permease subunit